MGISRVSISIPQNTPWRRGIGAEGLQTGIDWTLVGLPLRDIARLHSNQILELNLLLTSRCARWLPSIASLSMNSMVPAQILIEQHASNACWLQGQQV